MGSAIRFENDRMLRDDIKARWGTHRFNRCNNNNDDEHREKVSSIMKEQRSDCLELSTIEWNAR